MGVMVSGPLPELVPVPCTGCGGDGYTEDHTGAAACEACDATGELEVCSVCRRVPTVAHGVEVCGCTLATFPLVLGRVA